MIKGLYEAHLPVRDLKRSIEFYASFDLELAYETPKLAFFWIVKGQRRPAVGLVYVSVRRSYHYSLRHRLYKLYPYPAGVRGFIAIRKRIDNVQEILFFQAVEKVK